MQNNLLSIFKAITPDNIKNIPLIEDSSRIFIELLNEYSPISSDIKIALSEKTTPLISDELQKIYLYDYYSMIQNIKKNKNIVEKFRNWNEALKPSLYPKGLPYIGDKLLINYFTIGEPGGVLSVETEESNINLFPLSEKLNNLEHNILQNKAENYFVNRMFKESKGLKKSVQFIYDILNEYLVNTEEQLDLKFEETGNPFELLISGSVDKDIYRESVAYLSHPLGFVYDYNYISELNFEDNYALLKIYKINKLEARCLSGNVEAYTKEVISIIEADNYIKIIFRDNFYLLQENNIVRYYNNLDELIKIYPDTNHCSIYIDYEIVYKSTLNDSVLFNYSTLTTDTYNGVNDVINFIESKEFKNNFIIGISTIGMDLISNDSEQIEVVNYIDIVQEVSTNNINDLINTEIFDNFTVIDSSRPLNSDETYDTALVIEDFNIEIF